jgi:hypothetical protein
MSKSPLLRGVLVALLLASPVAVGPTARAKDLPLLSAPSLLAACAAWREHFTDLIDQHRIAQEIDEDAFHEVLLQFLAARHACSAGSHASGLRMYEAIVLGRVHQRPLK